MGNHRHTLAQALKVYSIYQFLRIELVHIITITAPKLNALTHDLQTDPFEIRKRRV